jgi:outer membrane lipoprotein-sorting protein
MMIKPNLFRRLCYCFAVIVLSFGLNISPTWAAEQEELESFLKTLQKSSDQVLSFSSEFVQEKHLALFSQPVLFTGKLVIVRPDRLRWEFTSPIPSVLLFNGDQGTRCNDRQQPEHFQLSSDPIMKTVAEQLWLWLGGDYNHLNSLYNLEKKGESTLVIRPRDSQTSEYITAVSISFNSPSLQPRQVEISEPGGDLTRILFGTTVINGELPESLFTQCLAHE